MFRYLPIRSVTGREILDSRGNPTVEVEVAVGEGILGPESIYLSNGIDILNCNAKNIIQKYIRKGNYHET